MKALVYTQPGEMQWLDRPMPELAAGEVVLKIEAVGICGSDMHAWHGHDPRMPTASIFSTTSPAASSGMGRSSHCISPGWV